MYQHIAGNFNPISKFLLGLTTAVLSVQPAVAASGQVVQLTQTPCQFLESEGNTNHGYESSEKTDCEVINDRTAEQRLNNAETLELKAGDYIFRVENRNVPYDLGFWLRGDGLINRARLPGVSGGGLSTGTTRDYKISLEPGEYVYSCPLNATPDYKLVVTE